MKFLNRWRVGVVGFALLLAMLLGLVSLRSDTLNSEAAAKDAEILSRRLLGLTDTDGHRRRSATIEAARGSEFPASIAQRLASARVRKIEYDSIMVFERGQQKRNVSVVLNESTGELLKIDVSGSRTYMPQRANRDLDSVGLRLLEQGMCLQSRFDSVEIPFLAVVRACPHASDGGPLTAVYVNDSCYHGRIAPYWIIAIPDHYPEPIAGVPDVPDSVLNKHHYISTVFRIDGQSGRVLSSLSFNDI